MKIDLQIHTNHSDGHESPEEIVALAKEGNLDVIAITDHDIVSGVSSTKDAGNKDGIKVIPGVEITTGYRGQPIHVLGYQIDTANPELVEFLQSVNDYRQNHFVSMFDQVNKNLTEKGMQTVDVEEYKNKAPKYYSIPGIALFLYEKKIVEGRNDGFAYIGGVSDVAPTIEPKEAFAIIHKAGGKAFLSHPFAPKISLKNVSEDQLEQEKIVVEFKEQGMDGLECFGTGHAQEDVDFSLMLVEKHDLLISAGSDWHGCLEKTGETIKQWLPFYLKKLGDLEVPEERIKQILKGLDVEM
jgi:predicted metal-dependent phosphoesterase TrpH